jgi:hypothetical protein
VAWPASDDSTLAQVISAWPSGHPDAMRRGPSDLVVVAALCRMLLEALDQLDEEIASEAVIANLREVCEKAHLEIERQPPSA